MRSFAGISGVGRVVCTLWFEICFKCAVTVIVACIFISKCEKITGFRKRLVDGSDDPEKNVAPEGVIFVPGYLFLRRHQRGAGTERGARNLCLVEVTEGHA